MRWIVCLIFTLFAPALWAGPAPTLIIMEPEIEGDTSDPAQKAAWPGRLENLQAEMQRGLAEAGLYDVLDPSVAEAEFAKHRLRRGVFSCKPCIRGVAEASDADRVLSLKVHRMSQLIISLQAVIRDADTLKRFEFTLRHHIKSKRVHPIGLSLRFRIIFCLRFIPKRFKCPLCTAYRHPIRRNSASRWRGNHHTSAIRLDITARYCHILA
ncbi:DUF2380 domain-containing protein [Halovulum sp. GXIMD14793]